MAFIENFAIWLTKTVENMGYIGILLLMALESSFVPFPSEVVIPPGGAAAAIGNMSLPLVILFGILGSLIGVLINYCLALWLGRRVLVIFGTALSKIPLIGRFVGFNENKVQKWEEFFKNHGEISTFVGRLIPGIRQYISFPAGLAKMNIFRFLFFTALGAGIWITILAYLGYFLGKNSDLIKENIQLITMLLIFFVLLVLVCYIYFYKRANKQTQTTDKIQTIEDNKD